MEDSAIIQLYFERDEQAITATKKKYGNYLLTVANNILSCREDAEDCENETYLVAWNEIPPKKPSPLSAFLAKIARNLSFKKLRFQTAAKRAENQALLSLDELAECIPDSESVDTKLNAEQIAGLLNRFLAGLKKKERLIFVCRYWFCTPTRVIAKKMGLTESNVKVTLMRTRKKLLNYLKEGDAWI